MIIIDGGEVKFQSQVKTFFNAIMPDFVKPHPVTGLPTFESLTDHGFILKQRWDVKAGRPIYYRTSEHPREQPYPPQVWLHPRDHAWVMFGDEVPLSIMDDISFGIQLMEIQRRAKDATRRVDFLTDIYNGNQNQHWDGLRDLAALEGKQDGYAIERSKRAEISFEELSRIIRTLPAHLERSV